MAAPDNDPSNLNQYEGYEDPTGTPTPAGPKATEVGLRQISQADYDALSSAEKAEGVLYVIPGV